MKYTTFWFILWMAMPKVCAQQHIEKHFDFNGKSNLNLNIRFADSIRIVTWDKPEVWVQVDIDINNNADNEAYMTEFEDAGNEVVMRSDFKKGYDGKKNCCNETRIYWVLHIPANAPFKLETINGNVSVTGTPGKLSAKTISGFIDISIPRNQIAALEMKTISGRMYTDLNQDNLSPESTLPLVVILKPGRTGIPVDLETISGDIFVRTNL